MKRQTIIILLVIFLMLLGMSISPYLLPHNEKTGTGTMILPEIPFSSWTNDTVTSVQITHGNTALKLHKESTGWFVNTFKASETKVHDFLTTLSQSMIQQLVSKNNENFQRMGVDQTNGYTITIEANHQSPVTLIVGMPGSMYNTIYLRLGKSNMVYLIKTGLRSFVTSDVSAWRDKTIISISSEKIHTIEEQQEKIHLVVQKNKEGKWEATWGKKTNAVPENMMNDLLQTLTSLEASDFLSDQDKQTFENTKQKTILSLFDANHQLLWKAFMVEQKGQWWIHGETQSEYYQIPSYTGKKLVLPTKDLFPST